MSKTWTTNVRQHYIKTHTPGRLHNLAEAAHVTSITAQPSHLLLSRLKSGQYCRIQYGVQCTSQWPCHCPREKCGKRSATPGMCIPPMLSYCSDNTLTNLRVRMVVAPSTVQDIYSLGGDTSRLTCKTQLSL